MGSLKGRMATAGLGSVGGYREPLQGMHLRAGGTSGELNGSCGSTFNGI